MPEELLSDQGPEFESELMTKLCKAFGFAKIRTSPYRPSTNGMVECLHRTLNQMLAKVVCETQRDCDLHVSAVMAAYRASQHSVTGYTPHFLMLGGEVRTPIDLVLGAHTEETMHELARMSLSPISRSVF